MSKIIVIEDDGEKTEVDSELYVLVALKQKSTVFTEIQHVLAVGGLMEAFCCANEPGGTFD